MSPLRIASIALILALAAGLVPAGSTLRASLATDGTQPNGTASRPGALSADGRFVAFESDAGNLVVGDTNGSFDVFVRDSGTGVTSRVSVSSGGSQGNVGGNAPDLSSDGRFVAFQSASNNLVAGDNNGTFDVFVHDRETGSTTRVSVATGGGQGNGASVLPAISADGRVVAFRTLATNLVANDTNGVADVFVHDR